MSSRTHWFITGSSRGIGLAIVRQLAASPNNLIIASCRSPNNATELKAISRNAKAEVWIVPLDTSSVESIQGVEGHVEGIIGDGALDYLLNNAAISEGDDRAFSFSVDGFMKTLETNVVGPAFLTNTLLPYLERSKRAVVMNTTSSHGSFGLNYGPSDMTYSISKTALNMLTYKQAQEKPDIIFVCVDPGWVSTDMGGSEAILTPEYSASSQIKILETATPEQSGKCLRYDGKELPR